MCKYLCITVLFLCLTGYSVALCERQLVTFVNNENWCKDRAIWGVSYDEQNEILYIRCWLEAAESPWNKRGHHILKALKGEDYLHFTIPRDQSELDEINSFKVNYNMQSVTQPNVFQAGTDKWLYFVTQETHSFSIFPQDATIHAAKWNYASKKWEVKPEYQDVLQYVNGKTADVLPFVADNGLSLYFTSDYNRLCTDCACDNGWVYLEGSCFAEFKYTRQSVNEPFQAKSDGIQIMDNGYINFSYLHNITVFRQYFEDYNRFAAASVSQNGIVVYNGPALPGKTTPDFDNIYMAKWDGTKLIDGYNMREINDVTDPIKEKPDILADGSGFYFASGPTADSTRLYFLDLSKVEDRDRDGYDDCIDCNDANASIHPRAVDPCSNSIDEDCNYVDTQCKACLQGIIPSSGCTCNGNIYYSGYCCAVWQATSCSQCIGIDSDCDNRVEVNEFLTSIQDWLLGKHNLAAVREANRQFHS